MSAPGSGQEAFRRVRRPTVLAFSRRLRLLKKFMVLLLDGVQLMFGAASTTPFVLSEKPSETRTQEGTDVAPKNLPDVFFSSASDYGGSHADLSGEKIPAGRGC